MIDQLSEIYHGWMNWLNHDSLSDDMRRVAKLRLQSCSKCEYSKERWVKKVWDQITGKKERRFTGYKCEICTCPLDQKSVSWASQCPLPEYDGKLYPQIKRWGKVQFDSEGKVVGGDNVYVTALSTSLESLTPEK